MQAAFKLLAASLVLFGLTTFGMAAICLTERDPSPTARMTHVPTVSGPATYDGKPLLY